MAGDTKRGVFVGDLHESVTEEELKREFSKCGVVIDCRVIRDEKGRSKKFGFINFESDAGRINALHSMNGAFICGSQVNVRDKKYKDSDKIVIKQGARPNDLYCGNLPGGSPPEEIKRELQAFFSIYNVVDIRVMRKGYCFVSFPSPGDALIALEAIKSQNALSLLGKIVIVQVNRDSYGTSSDPATAGLTIEQLEIVEKAKRTLYVGNLPTSLDFDEKKLNKVFQKLVDVKKSMIVRDEKTGQSMGYGFVELSSSDLAESVVQRVSELVVDGTQLTAQISTPPKELQSLLIQQQPYVAQQPQYFQDPATGQFYVLSSQLNNNQLPGYPPVALQPQPSYPQVPKPMLITPQQQPMYPLAPQAVQPHQPQLRQAVYPLTTQPGFPTPVPTQPSFAPPGTMHSQFAALSSAQPRIPPLSSSQSRIPPPPPATTQPRFSPY